MKNLVEQVKKDECLYKKPWFWICLTIIIVCLTKPNVIAICGNNNGNNNKGNETKTDK